MDTLEKNIVADQLIRENTVIYDDMTCGNYYALVQDLQRTPANNYSIRQAEVLADRVLVEGGHSMVSGVMPIVDIVKQFGFSCFLKSNMDEDTSGNIFVGGTTKQVYGTGKVIVVGDEEEVPHQRFIIAHELAHYLMDYLGSKTAQDCRILFTEKYLKQDHNSQKEIRADRFAAELLMPMNIFTRRYMRLMRITSNDLAYTVTNLSHYFGMKESSIRKRIREVCG